MTCKFKILRKIISFFYINIFCDAFLRLGDASSQSRLNKIPTKIDWVIPCFTDSLVLLNRKIDSHNLPISNIVAKFIINCVQELVAIIISLMMSRYFLYII